MWPNSQEDPNEKTELWRSEDDPHEATGLWLPEDSATPDLPLLAWLVVALPLEQRGMLIELGANSILGRGRDVDIRWDDERLSRQHARFWVGLDPQTNRLAYFITPLEARKPIELNQQMIQSSARLYENDRLLLGDTLFVVKLLE